jgi:tetratricopeptide (TPR) repeat protein
MQSVGGNSDCIGCDEDDDALLGIQSMSEEMALYLFRFCSLQSKYSIAMVSKYYRRLVSDKSLKLKESLLEVAISITEKQDYKRGLLVLQRICHLFPNCAEVWKEVGLCYKQMEDYENAVDSLFIAYDNCEGTFRLYIESQIYLYAKTNGIDLAYSKICEAIEQDPTELKYYHFRAFIEAAIQSNFSNSEEDLMEKHQQSLTREFQDYEFIAGKPYSRMASIYNNIGAVYFEQGLVEKALEHFEKSLGLCPAYVQAFYNKAIVWRSIGSARNALLEYDAILRANPALKRIHTLKGQCYYALRMYSVAESEFFADFLQGFTNNTLDYDSLNGFYKSLIRTKNIGRLFDYLPTAIERLVVRVREASAQLEKGPKPLDIDAETVPDASWRQSLREEAHSKQFRKIYGEALNALKLAVRIHSELTMVRDLVTGPRDGEAVSSTSSSSTSSGSSWDFQSVAKEFQFEDEMGDFIPFVRSRIEFESGGDESERTPLPVLTIHSTPKPHRRPSKIAERKSPRSSLSPIGEFGSIGDRSTGEEKQSRELSNGHREKSAFYWNFLVSLGDCSILEDCLNRKKEPQFGLKTLQSQVQFVACYAYFYLGVHSPPHSSLSVVGQFIDWLSIQRKQKTLLSAISSSHYVIIYLFEIFKLTEFATDKRNQMITVLREKIERLIHLKRNVVSLSQARDSLFPNSNSNSSSTSRSRSNSSESRNENDFSRRNNIVNSNGILPDHYYRANSPVRNNGPWDPDVVIAQALLSMLSLHGDEQAGSGQEQLEDDLADAEYVEDVFLVREYERRREEMERREQPRPSPRAPVIASPSILLSEPAGDETNYNFIVEHYSLFFVDLYDLVRYSVLAIGQPAFHVSYF